MNDLIRAIIETVSASVSVRTVSGYQWITATVKGSRKAKEDGEIWWDTYTKIISEWNSRGLKWGIDKGTGTILSVETIK